jgi:hypothetical protein
MAGGLVYAGGGAGARVCVLDEEVVTHPGQAISTIDRHARVRFM